MSRSPSGATTTRAGARWSGRAAVTLGGQTVTTDASSRATLAAPLVPGPYPIAATAKGMADAFPAQVVVK